MNYYLESRREALNLSQIELASKAGISQNHYSNIENGLRKPSLPTAQRIARALGCTIDELFGSGDTEEKRN